MPELKVMQRVRRTIHGNVTASDKEGVLVKWDEVPVEVFYKNGDGLESEDDGTYIGMRAAHSDRQG